MIMKKLNRLTPALKDYLWGGNRLAQSYHKDPGDLKIVAESWELSTHPDGISKINDESLLDYVKEHPEVLGTACKTDDIPLLIKFIDAKGNLSIQVHPDDEYARRVEHDNGKTEMWVIVDAEPGAFLYLGLKEKMTSEEFRKHIEDNTITNYLNYIPVHKGEVYLVVSRTLHAIGKGCLIMEIQERSNVTYRVYDYNRKDAQGHTRPLHIAKAEEVTRLEPYTVNPYPSQLIETSENGRLELLRETDYFHVYSLQVLKELSIDADEKSFISLTMTQNYGTVTYGDESVVLEQGQSLFIPAGAGKVTIHGVCEAIAARL